MTKKNIYVLSLCFYFICLPLGAINIGAFGSLLKVVAVLPIITGFANLKIQFNKITVAHFLFVLFSLASLLWTKNFDLSLNRVISHIELLLLLLSGSSYVYDEKDIERIKRSLVWSSRFTALILIIFADFKEGRLWLTGVISEDPNYICAYLAFGSVFAVQKILDNQKFLTRIVGILETFVYLYLILLTGSRGGLLAVAAGIVSYFLIFFKKTGLKKLFLIIVLATLFILSMNIFMGSMSSTIQSRFTLDSVTSSGGSGRTKLWAQAIDLFLTSNPFRWLFGQGTATVRYCFNIYDYPMDNVVHNMFLETLVELGIFGLILYCLSIFGFTKAAFRFRDMFPFAVITVMIVLSLSTSIYLFKPYFNTMLYILIYHNSISTKHIETHYLENNVICEL